MNEIAVVFSGLAIFAVVAWLVGNWYRTRGARSTAATVLLVDNRRFDGFELSWVADPDSVSAVAADDGPNRLQKDHQVAEH